MKANGRTENTFPIRLTAEEKEFLRCAAFGKRMSMNRYMVYLLNEAMRKAEAA